MLRFGGGSTPINVQKVLWATGELESPYERTDAACKFGVVNEPFYRRMNPNGRVPTIEDGGSCYGNRTRSCVSFGEARCGHALAERSPQRADADRWMDWTTSTVAPAAHAVFWA